MQIKVSMVLCFTSGRLREYLQPVGEATGFSVSYNCTTVKLIKRESVSGWFIFLETSFFLQGGRARGEVFISNWGGEEEVRELMR